MSSMTEQEFDVETDKIFTHLHDLAKKANDVSTERLQHFFNAMAFGLGSLIPHFVIPEGIGPITAKTVSALIAGMEAAVEVQKIPIDLTVIRKGDGMS